MPLISCPLCSAPVDVPISRAGSEIECVSCNKKFTVPKLGELRRLESECATSAVQAGAAVVTSPAAGLRGMFAVLLGIAALAIVGGSYCLIRYIAIQVPATTEDHLAEVDQLYPQMLPSQLVGEWRDLSVYSEQLARPYVYKLIADEKSKWLNNALLGYAIAAIAGFVAWIAQSLGRTRAE
jgi:hypothetical protein